MSATPGRADARPDASSTAPTPNPLPTPLPNPPPPPSPPAAPLAGRPADSIRAALLIGACISAVWIAASALTRRPH